MKDVRIVIVSWNVEKLLERCLRSLSEACQGLDWECVVVDNASADGSVDLAQHIAHNIPQIRVIANTGNEGFAKACNKGAEGSEARYVLFLNPDTECPAGSLAKLVELADARPKAGILGPKLLNADGSVQVSVRRFPDIWSQLGILFKLHHVFRNSSVFKRYFADDIDPETEHHVDQVMGSCFLVRRELIEAKMGFDERYFIWFEEVDFCLTAKKAGWDVAYVPQTSIIHHGGQSFGQVFTLKKQRYFDDSLKKYFAKWHPGWQAMVIALAHYPALALAWLAGVMRTSWGPWAALVLAVESVSAATIFHSMANTIACLLAGLVMIGVAYKKPQAGLAVLALELAIGSKGYLLQVGGWPSHISLRIVLTAAFLVGWIANASRAKACAASVKRVLGRAEYVILAILILFALFQGWRAGYTDVLVDANAWFELALLIPVLDIAARHGAALRKTIVSALMVGVIWLATKTLMVELLFSHQVSHIYGIYLWLRRTGVGEVTRLAGSVFRVFFQSQIYLLLAWFIGAAFLLERRSRLAWWTLALSASGLLLGFSRSFAVGIAIGGISLAWSMRKRLTGSGIGRVCGSSIAGFALAIAVIFAPLPGIGGVSPSDLLNSRLNDAAAQSRWELLPAMWAKIKQAPIIGHGFGATVTYTSHDPRLVEQGVAQTYTTYAFEWGWLEFWIKFGILGPLVMAYILIRLGKNLWRSEEPLWVRAGAVTSLVALAAVHMFTPYLNHPLGFLCLFLAEGMILSEQTRKPV